MDKIIIKGLKIFAYHGVNIEEKQNGQYFIVDAVLYTPLNKAGSTDRLRNTVSYSKAAKLINKVVQSKKYDLLETVVDKVAYNLFREFRDIQEVIIRLSKPDAPINLEFEYMAVEIHRKRSDYYKGSSC